MDRLKDSAFDNLIAELRKKSFKGSQIDFSTTKDTGYLYRLVHSIEILFKDQPAFRDLDPTYQSKLNGKITIEIDNDFYRVECEYPSTLLLSVIDEVRKVYYRHKKFDKPINSFGCGYCSLKRITKILQNAQSVLKWVDKLLELSYNSIIEGRFWWISESVQDDIKKYLESQKNISEYDSQISELKKKKNNEEKRFNEYDKKYRENFVRIRTAKSDF